MKLVEAEAADLPEVVALMNLAFPGRGAAASWNSEAPYIEGERTNLALLQSEIAAAPDARLLVHRDADGGAIVGSVWLEPTGEGVWYLGSLTVDPTLQKGGMGSSLLSAAEAWARARGATIVRMTVVNVRDTLIAWYERRGYARTGATTPFPYDDNRFGVPLRDDLAFVVFEKMVG